jgi:hypothetical protein
MATQIKLKQVNQEGATNGQAVVWNGTNWAPGTVQVSNALQIKNGEVITASPKIIVDQVGTESAMKISTTGVQIGTSGAGGGLSLYVAGSSDLSSEAALELSSSTGVNSLKAFNNGDLRLISSANNTGNIRNLFGRNYSPTAGNEPFKFIGGRARGASTAPTAVQSGDFLGSFVANAYNGTLFTDVRGGLSVVASENWTSSNNGTYLTLQGTAAGGTTVSEFAKVESTGLTISNIANATTDTDKFLVSDGGVIKYRTGTELVSDLGLTGGSGSGTVTGTGMAGQVAFWDATSNIAGSSNLKWDNATSWLGVGTGTMSADRVDIQGTAASEGGQIGAELLSTGANSMDWVGTTWASGYQHTANTNVTPLMSLFVPTTTTSYTMSWTVTSRTTGSFVLTFGGYTSTSQTASGTATYTATTTAYPIITPTADFNGKIVLSITASSVEQLTGSYASAPTGSWTGTSFLTGIQHTGSTADIVPFGSTASISNGAFYQASITVSDRTAGSVTMTYGGLSSGAISANNTTSIAQSATINTQQIRITPTIDFNGTVTASVKRITASTMATFVLKNSSGTVVYEQRASESNTNTFQGIDAGSLNTTGSNNIFQGQSAGKNNTTGSGNVFQGQTAGLNNTTGFNNFFQGRTAGLSTTTGSNNVFTGSAAGYSNTIGGNNLYQGFQAGFNNVNGSSNVFQGLSAGQNITAGSNNILTGHNVGFYIGTGTTTCTLLNNSIIIGSNSRTLADNETNALVIGYLGRGLGSNTSVIGNSSTIQTWLGGKVSVGTTSNTAYLNVQGSGSTNATTSLLIQNSSLTPLLTVKDDGSTGIGTSTIASDRLDIQGTTASDGGQIGAELATIGTFDASWSGVSFASGYTHTAGTDTSITTTLTAVIGSPYQLIYTITQRTTGGVTISFGGLTTGSITTTGTTSWLQTKTISGTTLTVTPTTDFNGKVVISVKQITAGTVATLVLKNSSGTIISEQRATKTESLYIGVGAGKFHTTGTGNVGIGNTALGSVTSGSSNIAVGPNALASFLTGNSNFALGSQALFNLISGINNTAIGTQALLANTSSSSNVAIGTLALGNAQSGNNVGVGRNALNGQTSGNANTGIGDGAGQTNTTGGKNIFIGLNSGRYFSTSNFDNTVVNNSIFIGYQAKALLSGSTNETVLGYDAIGLGSNTSVIGSSATTRAKIWGSLENQSSGTTNATTSLLIQNSATTPLLTIKDDGLTLIGQQGNNNYPTINTGSLYGGVFINAVSQATIRISGADSLKIDGVGAATFSAQTGTATSGTTGFVNLSHTIAASGAGNANFRPLNIAYNINNVGAQSGNTTGIFLSATETALGGMTHNLMELKVGDTSVFKISGNAYALIGRPQTLLTGTSGFSFLTIGSSVTNSVANQNGNVSAIAPAMTFAGTSVYFIGNSIYSTSAITNTNVANRIRGITSILSTSSAGAANDTAAFLGSIALNSTGAVTNAIAFEASISKAGSSTLTNAYGLKINDLVNSAGTITNTFGLYVGDITTGTQTNTAYSLYLSDANALTYIAGQTSIGAAAPAATSILDLTSTTQGFLLPRMTTIQRNNISLPANGLMVYDTDLGQPCFYDTVSARWNKMSHSAA